MPLNEDDVREILRLIDETDVEELRVEIGELSLYVLRGGAPAAVPEPSNTGAELLTIQAPMLGTFYRAPAPGETPFVAVGTRVDANTVVCVIEVMKMMNSIPAGVAGTIVEVCADNAQLVEFGAPLFQVQPT